LVETANKTARNKSNSTIVAANNPILAGRKVKTLSPTVRGRVAFKDGRQVPQQPKFNFVVDAAKPVVDRHFRDYDSMSITPIPPNPLIPRRDSAICESAVALAVANGLPSFLAEPAYRVCENYLPQLAKLGVKAASNSTQYLYDKIRNKFGGYMAKGKKSTPMLTQGSTASKSAASGRGDYTRSVRSAPAAFSVRQKGSGRPAMKSSARGLSISHSEMIGNLVTSTTASGYVSYSFVANPGKFATFPWMSTIASNFDKYVMRRLVVHLVSNQPTTIGGKIGIGFDYDSTDPMPSDRNEFFSLTHHMECAPWDSVSLTVPLDNKPRFVNSHTTSDSKLIDVGQILLMADQITATSTPVADIIVEYTVELLEPQQAIYATMAVGIDGVGSFTSFDKLVVAGPVVGNILTTSSTTELEFQVPQGYYTFGLQVLAASGSPRCGVSVHNCSGKYSSSADTTVGVAIGKFKCEKPDGRLKLTFSGVAIASLGNFHIHLTRISASAYNAFVANVTNLTTY
jgi:hypothetical protein